MGVGEPNAGRTIAMVALSLAIGGALLGAAAMPTVAGFSPIGDPLERTAPGSLVDAEDDPGGVEDVEGVDGPEDDQLRRSGDRTAGAEGAEGTAAAGGEGSAIAENAAAAEAAAYGLAALFAAMGGSEEDVAAAAARSGAPPETIEAAAGSEGEIDPEDFDGAGADASGPLDAPLSPDGFDGELGGLYGDVPAQDREIGLDGSADPGAVDPENVDPEDVDADDVDGGGIDPDDVDANDVDAEDVEADDLDSDDIDADDVDPDDVDAGAETDSGDADEGDDRESGADDGMDGTDDGGTEDGETDADGIDTDGTDSDDTGGGGTDADGTDDGGTDTDGTDDPSDGESATDEDAAGDDGGTDDAETDRETGGTDDADDDARGSLDLGDDGEESEATPSDSDDDDSGSDGGDAADPEADTGEDEALSDAVPGGDRAPTIALLALAALALGYVFLTKDEPIAYLLAIPRRLGAVALAVLVACSNALERAVSALGRVTSIAELPGVILAGVLAAIGGARRRVRETTASLYPFASDDEGAAESEAATATARERIAEAWESVVAASSVYRVRVRTSTPASVARRAKERGAPAGAVEEITEAFRDVEYGGYDPNPRVEPVSEAEDELRAALRAREDEE